MKGKGTIVGKKRERKDEKEEKARKKCSRREVNGREERIDRESKMKIMGRDGESEALYGMERKKGLKRAIDNGEKEKKATGMKNLWGMSIRRERNERQRKKRAGRIRQL